MNMDKRYMPQLDGLRFFAVFGVAWHHWMPSKYHFHLPWNAGVQLFFVLSGFLISGILMECRSAMEDNGLTPLYAFRQFYIRRFLRIFPLYYAVLAAAAFINLEAVRSSVGWHLSYLSNFYFLKLGYFDSYLSHFWTLAVEEQFYLFWPALIFFIPKRFLFGTLVAVVMLATIHRILGGDGYYNSTVYGISTMDCLDSLALGALLALGTSKSINNVSMNKIWKYRDLIGWSSVAVYVLFFILDRCKMSNYISASFQEFFLNICFAFLILKASRGLSGFWGQVLSWPVISYLGRISYGLYVYHMFALLAVPKLFSCFSAEDMIKHNLVLSFLSMSAWTILIASISWYVFEKPLNSLKRFFPYTP